MRAPKKMYWVEFSRGDGPSLRYAQRGGGKYSSRKEAERRVAEIRKRGNQAFMHETDCNWRMVLDV